MNLHLDKKAASERDVKDLGLRVGRRHNGMEGWMSDKVSRGAFLPEHLPPQRVASGPEVGSAESTSKGADNGPSVRE
jgi:hypothetical protein